MFEKLYAEIERAELGTTESTRVIEPMKDILESKKLLVALGFSNHSRAARVIKSSVDERFQTIVDRGHLAINEVEPMFHLAQYASDSLADERGKNTAGAYFLDKFEQIKDSLAETVNANEYTLTAVAV